MGMEQEGLLNQRSGESYPWKNQTKKRKGLTVQKEAVSSVREQRKEKSSSEIVC